MKPAKQLTPSQLALRNNRKEKLLVLQDKLKKKLEKLMRSLGEEPQKDPQADTQAALPA
jgi:hypothetical protein